MNKGGKKDYWVGFFFLAFLLYVTASFHPPFSDVRHSVSDAKEAACVGQWSATLINECLFFFFFSCAADNGGNWRSYYLFFFPPPSSKHSLRRLPGGYQAGALERWERETRLVFFKYI